MLIVLKENLPEVLNASGFVNFVLFAFVLHLFYEQRLNFRGALLNEHGE